MCLHAVINLVLMGDDPRTDDFRSTPLPLQVMLTRRSFIYLFKNKIKWVKSLLLGSFVNISLRVTAISSQIIKPILLTLMNM
jgi:hypothetical protein